MIHTLRSRCIGIGLLSSASADELWSPPVHALTIRESRTFA
jgi:hypothetical protein